MSSSFCRHLNLHDLSFFRGDQSSAQSEVVKPTSSPNCLLNTSPDLVFSFDLYILCSALEFHLIIIFDCFVHNVDEYIVFFFTMFHYLLWHHLQKQKVYLKNLWQKQIMKVLRLRIYKNVSGWLLG